MIDVNRFKERILAEVAERNKTNPLLDFPVALAIGRTHRSPKSGRTMELVRTEVDKRMYEDKWRSSAST